MVFAMCVCACERAHSKYQRSACSFGDCWLVSSMSTVMGVWTVGGAGLPISMSLCVHMRVCVSFKHLRTARCCAFYVWGRGVARWCVYVHSFALL